MKRNVKEDIACEYLMKVARRTHGGAHIVTMKQIENAVVKAGLWSPTELSRLSTTDWNIEQVAGSHTYFFVSRR